MERFHKLVGTLNSYEKSILNKDDAFLTHKEEVLSSLSKSKRFGEVYKFIKENKLKLNNLLLPYRVYKDKATSKLLYEVKKKHEFEDDYRHAMYLIQKYYHFDQYLFGKLYKFSRFLLDNLLMKFEKFLVLSLYYK